MANNYECDDYELFSKEPEALNVGKLNNAVRRLRELLYDKSIQVSKLEHEIFVLKERTFREKAKKN